MDPIREAELKNADLMVDHVYQGGRAGNASDDTLPHLIGVSNQGGFRYIGTKESPKLAVLTSTLKDLDWPDSLDGETGIFTHYGDNKKPGHELPSTPRFGNLLLRDMFERTHGLKNDRLNVPSVLIFANTGTWRDAQFLGLAVPGVQNLDANSDLVAVWKTKNGKRFQNYSAQTNPAREVAYISGATEGFHTWMIDEVQTFEAAHPVGTKARLAMALLLYTGVRRSDVVRLGPDMERDGAFHFTEAKGRNIKKRGRTSGPKHRTLPVMPELRAILDASSPGGTTYLVTEFNKPFTANGFGNRFRKWCDEAGLTHCSAHGLRKAGATIAAENGATEHQLMAIYGWESPKQAALYTRKANRQRLAAQAMHLLVPSVPPSSNGTGGGTNPGKRPN